MDSFTRQHLRHNWTVNLLDGGFFGFALGFASFTTILPLFVSTLTDSAILIGLIPAIHAVGWQLPQLFTVRTVSRQLSFKPMVLRMTIHERLPFLGLALAAFLAPSAGARIALWLTFAMLIWQGLGGGFTATAWQSMIGKIIPGDSRGSFYGAQSAAAHVLGSIGAVAAGFILERFLWPRGYVVLFLLATFSMAVSYAFLSLSREQQTRREESVKPPSGLWGEMGGILRSDRNFRSFLIVRMLGQLAMMGFAFYTVYFVREHGLSEASVGIMTGVMLGAQIVANPVVGWIGDRISHRTALGVTIAAAGLSAMVAYGAQSIFWFYLVFLFTGAANALWTVALAIVLDFGEEPQRPVYIGLANTLVAPATILAPFLGGWLAESLGYRAVFLASVWAGAAALLYLLFFMRDPRRLRRVE